MRAIIFLAGLAVVASWFLTWIELPFAGPDLSPSAALGDRLADLPEARWQTMVFVASFALAGLAAFLALFGVASGPVALLAGVSPFVVGVDAYLRADELRRDLGLPFPIDVSDLPQVMEVADDFVRLGLWAYLGGAIMLLLAGLSLLASRR